MDHKKQGELIETPKTVKQLAIGMFSYTSVSILGPLVFFLGIGYYLDFKFDTKPIFMIIALFSAFIITNFLIYKKISVLINDFDKKHKDEEANKKKASEDESLKNER